MGPADMGPADMGPADMGPADMGPTDGGVDESPTVGISAPAMGALLGPMDVVVSATAADDMGIDRVEFFAGTTLLGSSPVAPYQVTWDTRGLLDGTLDLRAVAFDSIGQSSEARRSVTLDLTAPQVTLTMPTPGTRLSTGTADLAATVTDASAIALYEFLVGGAVVWTSTSPPFSTTVTGLASGPIAITARATDLAGNAGTADSTVVVDRPPTVRFTAPSASAIVRGSVAIVAEAQDDNSVARVEFFVDGQSLIVDTTAPYGATFDAVSAAQGPHALVAIATDDQGQMTQAQITVTVDDRPPMVTIDAPVATSTVFGIVTISATPSDDVAVSTVSLFADATRLSMVASAPFAVDWDTCTTTDGPHTVSVSATDGRGQSTTSTINLSVDNALNPPVLTGLGGVDSVDLSWTTCRTGLTYNLYWDDRAGVTTTSSVVSVGAANMFTHAGRTMGQTYFYRVAAVDGRGPGALSNELAVMPLMEYGVAVATTNQLEVHELSLGADRTSQTISQGSISDPPTWSPAGTHIAFRFNQSVGYTTEARTALYQVSNTQLVQTLVAAQPSFSPDGNRILGTDNTNGCVRVYTISSGMQSCLPEPTRRDRPVWDPGGTSRFAFIGADQYTSQPTLLIRDEAALRFEVGSNVRAYVWAPNGSALAYVQNAGASCTLQRATVTASSLSGTDVLATGLDCNARLAWSPTTDAIAFSSQRGAQNAVFVLSLSGTLPVTVSSLRALGQTSRVIAMIDWTPDGEIVGFTAQNGLDYSLSMCPADGVRPSSTRLQLRGSAVFSFRPTNP